MQFLKFLGRHVYFQAHFVERHGACLHWSILKVIEQYNRGLPDRAALDDKFKGFACLHIRQVHIHHQFDTGTGIGACDGLADGEVVAIRTQVDRLGTDRDQSRD